MKEKKQARQFYYKILSIIIYFLKDSETVKKYSHINNININQTKRHIQCDLHVDHAEVK